MKPALVVNPSAKHEHNDVFGDLYIYIYIKTKKTVQTNGCVEAKENQIIAINSHSVESLFLTLAWCRLYWNLTKTEGFNVLL